MNKAEFRNKLASRLELPQYVSNNIIDACLDIIAQSLQEGDPITLQGFGSFTPWLQTERLGRNPRTGKDCMIAPRTSVKFKPGKYLLQKLNKN
ncbi:MAG: HU family DNA-binding protein [Parabacteroides gordonii]|jgi:DNA-binding protein HU-beta|uniref:HU family DNA-binding protein n=1 Tax=Parabacteroides gordonii TaxID=574930 RepID=UPI003A8BA9A8